MAAACALVAAFLSASCASAGGAGPERASEAEWRALATPRPTPLPGAARVAVAEIQLVGDLGWDEASLPLPAAQGIEELVVAGLLRRPDVHFVERRRFTAAVEAERAGLPRPPGAPRAGVSPGAEYLATATWIDFGDARSTVEIRLANAGTGRIATTHRVTPGRPGAVPLARSIVRGILEALDGIGRRPAWEDPRANEGGTTEGRVVGPSRLQSFVQGVVAESAWDWEAARRHYQAAADEAFHEAAAALARAARLRLGGTLGES